MKTFFEILPMSCRTRSPERIGAGGIPCRFVLNQRRLRNAAKPSSAMTTILLWLFLATLITQHPTPVNAQGSAIGDSVKVSDQSAVLELFSDSKGFLPPRLTTAQRDSISSPAEGLIVFDTDLNKLLYYHNGWRDMGLWSTRDSTSGNIFYPASGGTGSGGKVAIGAGSDTLPLDATLTVLGEKGILSQTVSDTAAFAHNLFDATLDNPGEFSSNVIINTVRTGDDDESATGGIFSILESNSHTSLANGAQTLYTGAGGTFEDNVPVIMGAYSDAMTQDTTVTVVARLVQYGCYHAGRH